MSMAVTSEMEQKPLLPLRSRHRGTTRWDGVRKDPSLWQEDGDCSIHLYAHGASQRGPCFRLRFSDIEALSSDYLIARCLYVRPTPSPAGSEDTSPDSGYASSRVSKLDAGRYELYLPAPSDLPREQAYIYHLTTRNFFAYATSQPVVGEKLGLVLADVLDRIRIWQPHCDALANLIGYCEEQGYLDMAENIDHALACLCLAENARLKTLWVEAFVHCVGMHEHLDLSPEFDSLTQTTKALITRSSLEMDLHIARVVRAVGSFLEEELGPENLGLSKPARDHLDRFRSCLQRYYVDKLGYFPPNGESSWNKRLWTKMYHAFQTLYEYLVDNESTNDRADARGMNGGICVIQNIQAFDQRHGYAPLPHPLPLLPELPSKPQAPERTRSLRAFMLGRADPAKEQRLTSRERLIKATNSAVQDVMACELVEEYKRFESQKLEEKLSIVEARKVRWLLIYGMLQMLISITRAPKEIRDTDTPSYPLCVLFTGSPSWAENVPNSVSRAAAASFEALPDENTFGPSSGSEYSIRPDCEAENAEEYFSAQGLSRQASMLSLDLAPPPLRITTQLSRSATIRSSVHALHRSLVGGLSRCSSQRRGTSSRPLSTNNSFSEIIIEGYGNGMNVEVEQARREKMLTLESDQQVESASLAAFDFGLDNLNEEPMLEDADVNGLMLQHPHDRFGRSPSESSISAGASPFGGSSRSSTYLSDFDSPATDYSPWHDESISPEKLDSRNCGQGLGKIIRAASHKRHSYQTKELNFGFIGTRTSCHSVNAGCYTPTGLRMPMSKYHLERDDSSSSLATSASSHYPEDSRQAAEIELEESRGRRRLRALDRVSVDEMEAAGRALRLALDPFGENLNT